MTFSALAPKLFALGYEVIPIPAGEKGPKLSGWQSIEITSSRVAAWARETPSANIGVRTKLTPAIDVDVTDQGLADEIERILTREGFGTCVRVGSAPKRLLVCRADQPFRKTVLKLVAPDGTKHAVEVLGQGQQFVAYGRHPKGHNYEWTSLDELDGVPLADLPLLTPDGVEHIFKLIAAAAGKRGWTTQQVGTASHTSTTDDALLTYQPGAADIDEGKARDALALVKNDDLDYDTWLQFGMAIHHQFAGGLEGLNLWHEWSANSGKYDPQDLDRRWESFHQMPASQTPITFRYVLKYASEGKQAKKRERMDEIRAEIAAVQSSERLYGKIAQNVGKLLESEIEIDLIVDAILKRGKELDGSGPSKAVLRKQVRLAYLTTRVNNECPEWLVPYVYVESDESFYNVMTHTHLSERAFNMLHNRLLLSEAERAAGQIQPEYPASVVAMNKYTLKSVHGFRYMPDAAELFEIDGVNYANSFDCRSMPSIPDTYSPEQQRAIALVEAHFALLFGGNEQYVDLLRYWLAYKVQNLGKHCAWAILVQGAEGAGKSFFSELLCGVLGVNNVGIVSPKAIKSNFTGWGEGALLNIIEEIRLHGENRWEVIDNVKPYITNAIVPIRKMRTDEYQVANVSAYLFFTNHQDALPLGKMDRRYCILASRFQTKDQLDRFNRENPDYFGTLFDTMREHFGALRKWLLEVQIPASFKPYGHAPMTDAKELMMDAARGDEADALEGLIENSTDPLVNCTVLSVSRLREMAAEQMIVLPIPNKLGHALDAMGYRLVGRARHGDERVRLWSKAPDQFPSGDLTAWLKLYLSDPFA